MTDCLLFNVDWQAKPVRDGPKHHKRRGRNLGPNPIPRQHQKPHQDDPKNAGKEVIERSPQVNASVYDSFCKIMSDTEPTS